MPARRMQALLTSLFGIESEIAAALQPGLEHSVAHVRMGWWAEEAARLRAGHALHPLTRALLAQRPAGGAAADISGLVDVATWDLAGATFETRTRTGGLLRALGVRRTTIGRDLGRGRPADGPRATVRSGHRCCLV